MATSAVLKIEEGAAGQHDIADARVEVPARVQPASKGTTKLGKPGFSEGETKPGAVRVSGVCVLNESVPGGWGDPCEFRLVTMLANET